ncbi:nucleotidyltransferase family protein [Cohnella endophytica]|nr:NTP transferase domain-containing protein [Cohnella endophytica]
MFIPKLRMELAPGKKLGSFALEAMRANKRIGSISVVVKEQDVREERSWLPDDEADDPSLRIVPCPDAAYGMSYSLRAGLSDVLAAEVHPDAIIIALADQPFITPDLIDGLIQTYQDDRRLDFVACAGDAIAVPPVLFAPSMYKALSELEGDAGARKLLSSPRYRGEVVQASSGLMLLDIDTRQDFEEARRCCAGLIK